MKKYSLLLLIFTISMVFQSTCFAQVGKWRMLIDKPTFDVAVNPKNYNTIYAGGEGRIFYRSYDGGRTWDTIEVGYRFGSTMFNNVIPNPEDTNQILIGGLNFGTIRMTTDQGNTWEIVLSKISPIELNGKSMHYKPGSKDTVYAGDFRYAVMYRSTDRGLTWDSLSTITNTYRVRRQDGTLVDTIMPTTIGAFNIRSDSTNILVVGSTSGEVFVSTDGGYTWKYTDQLIKTNNPSGQSDCEVTRVVFSERDPRVGYIVITYLFFNNLPNGGLHKTTDGGYSWDLVAFPDTSIWACDTRRFGDDDEVFIGGYTEDFYVKDSIRVPGLGILRRSQDGGKSWIAYDPHIEWAIEDPKFNAPLYAVHFPNKDTGYVVGGYGNIIKTTDGGAYWSKLLYEKNNYFKTVYFFDGRKGFVAGADGFLIYTENAGISWKEVNTNIKEKINQLKFINNNLGFAVCDNGIIIKTTDSGNNWSKLNSPVDKNLFSIHFINENLGFATGLDGILLKTTNGGLEWSIIDLQRNDSLNSIFFVDNTTGYICGQNGLILKTEDAGDNWIQLNTNTTLGFYSVHFPTKNVGFVAGVNGLILKTTDGGSSWFKIHPNHSRTIYSIYFPDEQIGAASGHLNTLAVTKNGGKNWEIPIWGYGPKSRMWSLRYFGDPGEEKLYLASEAGLFVLDYPSDINPRRMISKDAYLKIYLTPDNYLFIKYLRNDKCSSEYVTLRISDIMGREVYSKRFINSNGNGFESFLEIPALAKGLYICQLIDNDFVLTEKIIID